MQKATFPCHAAGYRRVNKAEGDNPEAKWCNLFTLIYLFMGIKCKGKPLKTPNSMHIFQHLSTLHGVTQQTKTLPEDTSHYTYFQGEDAGDAGDEVVDTAPPGLCWETTSINNVGGHLGGSSLQENPLQLEDLQLERDRFAAKFEFRHRRCFFEKKNQEKPMGNLSPRFGCGKLAEQKTQNSRIFRLIHGHEIQFYARKR